MLSSEFIRFKRFRVLGLGFCGQLAVLFEIISAPKSVKGTQPGRNKDLRVPYCRSVYHTRKTLSQCLQVYE